jgi:hypothetical protein
MNSFVCLTKYIEKFSHTPKTHSQLGCKGHFSRANEVLNMIANFLKYSFPQKTSPTILWDPLHDALIPELF